MQNFWLAMGFLTTIPTPSIPFEKSGLARAGIWFPWVGLIIGGILAGGQWLLSQLFPPLLTAALVVVIWVILTGGLHLDGLADCCDGLLTAFTPERRLEILRDPRLGAFGGIGLSLFLLLKVIAVYALLSASFALILAPVVARTLILIAARQPSARSDGLGVSFASELAPYTLLVAISIPVFMGILGGGRGLSAVALALLVTIFVVRLARNRLGGVTGDVFGLMIEMAELSVLLVYAMKSPF